MARKALIEKNKRSQKLIHAHADLRKELLTVIKDKNTSQVDRQRAYERLEKLPKRSSTVLYRNRCALTGRPRGYMRMFKLSRLAFRRLALRGILPGVKKASW